MASQPRQFTIEKQTYRGATPEGLAPVPMPTGEGAQAAAAGFGALAEKFSRWADQDAKAEGERDAKIAAGENRFDRTNANTIYGKAFDATALDAQLTAATSVYRDRTLTLFDQNRNNPAGLRTALDAEIAGTERDLPPELRASFRAKASELGAVLHRQAIVNQNSMQDAQMRATVLQRGAEAARQQSQVLTVSPSDPAAEAEVRRISAERIAQISSTLGLTDPVAAERLIQDERASAESRIIQARAATLRSPEEVDAYRANLRERFNRGEMPGVTDFQAVDAELQKLGAQKRVEGERQARALQTTLDDALTRAARGQQPTAAELAALEAEASKLGPRGTAMLENTRARMGIAQQLAGRPIAEQERIAREVERQATAATAPNPENERRLQGVSDATRRMWDGLSATPGLPALTITSAHRTREQNAAAGGATNSQHIHGNALDLDTKNLTDEQKAQVLAAAIANGARGIGIYPSGAMHIDTRATPTLWGPMGFGGARIEQFPAWARPHLQRLMETGGVDPPAGQPQRPGISRAGAELAQWTREQVNANRNAINADMLGYAADRGLAGGPVTVVDLNAPPDQLTNQMRDRVAQVDAVAPVLGQANPSYLRPDDKAALQGIVTAGGDRALATVEAIVRGGGARATTILKEIGGDAPALAHAAALSTATGDRSFARTVAEGLAARQVAGSSPQRPSNDDMDAAERKVLGAALRGLRTDERERTRAAVSLWVEVQAQRRGVDLKANASGLIEEGFRAARGETRQGDNTYGGVTTWRSPSWFGGSTEVQVPPNVRQDRFNDVLKAITSQDLAALPNPPVFGNGNPMDAEALRRMQPIYGPGGYRFALPPDSNGNRRPVIGKDGQPFVLPFAEMEPVLRSRVPGAFR